MKIYILTGNLLSNWAFRGKFRLH